MTGIRTVEYTAMPALIEAIEIKRKMYFEYEGAPYHVLDVDVSRPTARSVRRPHPFRYAAPKHHPGWTAATRAIWRCATSPSR